MKQYSAEDLNLCLRKKQTQRSNGQILSLRDLKEYDSFVINVAKKYKALFPAFDIEDLIEEGRIGLLEASLKYRNDKNASFSTYAWFWIIKKIQSYVSRNSGVLRIPDKERQIFSAIKKLIETQAKNGVYPDIKKVSEILNIKVSKASDTLFSGGNALNVFSLDKEIDPGSDSGSFAQIIEDKSEKDALSSVVYARKSEFFNAMFSKLSKDERNVVSLRYCIGGRSDKRVSYKTISEKMNIPVSKVKNLEACALLKLKAFAKDIDE
ncbi:MAG: sigma-70 family RNA polymerase sigma factor [Endomicrobium sp.]|nr:sigma-70 family RNA polymerase sigma factor [Endomicrobium sp.]